MATGGGIGGVGGTAAAPVLSRFCAQNGEAYGWFCIQEGTVGPGPRGWMGPAPPAGRPISPLTVEMAPGARVKEETLLDTPCRLLRPETHNVFFFFFRNKNTHRHNGIQ